MNARQIHFKEVQSFEDEKITLSKNKLKGEFACFSGKSGDFWTSIIPSLNVSGYGDSKKESLEDLRYNMSVFCEDLFALNEAQRHVELKKMGWKQGKFFKKKFSAAYIDKDGVLQNFDYPEDVESSMLQTA